MINVIISTINNIINYSIIIAEQFTVNLIKNLAYSNF